MKRGEPMTSDIKLTHAAKTSDSEHIVNVTYEIGSDYFTVEWTNLHEGDGKLTLGNFYLTGAAASNNPALEDRVEDALRLEEDDDNPDLELYLAIRDKFGHHDCIDVIESEK